jgi:hypothetical protein
MNGLSASFPQGFFNPPGRYRHDTTVEGSGVRRRYAGIFHANSELLFVVRKIFYYAAPHRDHGRGMTARPETRITVFEGFNFSAFHA